MQNSQIAREMYFWLKESASFIHKVAGESEREIVTERERERQRVSFFQATLTAHRPR